MEDYVPVVVASLVSLIVGFAIGYRQTYMSKYAFQNRGEAHLSRELLAHFKPPDYHLLNHLTLPTKTGTTQIDHVLISRFGIFVIETKDFGGWILANPNDSHWTQVLNMSRFRFQNPIRQNYAHVCAIQETLGFVPHEVIHSVVVFTGIAGFRTSIPGGVFYLKDVVAYLQGMQTEVLPLSRVQLCVGRLEAARLAVTRATDVEHVEGLRKRYRSND